MNHDKKLFLTYSLMIAGLLFFLPSLVNAFPTLEFDGDTVYINDSKAFISATPHTQTGNGYVTIEFYSKQYSGNVNILFGYNGDYITPKRLERYNPTIHYYQENGSTFNYTTYWEVVETNNFLYYQTVLDGKTDWYAKPNFNINANQNYKFRIWVNTPYLTNGQTQEEQYPDFDGKWDFAIYPSSYGSDYLQAYNNNQLFLLDPTYTIPNAVSDDWVDTSGTVSFTTFDGRTVQSFASTDEGYYDISSNLTGGTNWNIEAIGYLTSPDAQQLALSFLDSSRLGSSETGYICDAYQPTTGTYNSRLTRCSGGTCAWGTMGSSTSAFAVDEWIKLRLSKKGSTIRCEVMNEAESTVYANISNTDGSPLTGMGLLYVFNGDTGTSGVYVDSYTYDDGIASVNPFKVTAINGFDSSSITVFNATIDGSFYSTTNGTLNTGLLQNSTTLHNITIITTNHFNIVLNDFNVSSNYQAVMYQSDNTLACYEKITETLLSCVESDLTQYNAGTYEIQGNVSGYYPIIENVTINALDNKTINYTGFANSWLNINAINLAGSVAVSDFTINFTDQDSSWSESLTASGNYLNNTLIAGKNYTVFFTKSGLTSANYSFNNFSSQNYTFNVYEANSINISIFKESDLTLITDSVTIQFSDENATITNYQTSTGRKYINGLSAVNYTISFISGNYTTRTVDVSFNNDYQTLSVYLIASGSESTIFTFQDRDDGARIEGVTLSVQKLINTTWTLVESLTSDITGRTSFDYSTDVAYRFVATAPNYLDKNWTLDPILFSSYIIKLDKNYNLEDNSDFNGITVYFVPKTFKEDTNTSINFTFSNPNAEFVNYGFNATWDGINFVSDSGNTGIGSNLNATLEIVGSELNDYVTIWFYYELDNGESYAFKRTFLIQDSNTNGNIKDSLGNGYGLGLLERILIVVMIALLVAGAGAYFGGALAGGVLAMVVFGLFSYTQFISWWLTLPSIIVMFIIATWRSSS